MNGQRTTVEIEIKDVLDADQARQLTKAISELIDEHVGLVSHNVKAVAPLDQTWNEVSCGRIAR